MLSWDVSIFQFKYKSMAVPILFVPWRISKAPKKNRSRHHPQKIPNPAQTMDHSDTKYKNEYKLFRVL